MIERTKQATNKGFVKGPIDMKTAVSIRMWLETNAGWPLVGMVQSGGRRTLVSNATVLRVSVRKEGLGYAFLE